MPSPSQSYDNADERIVAFLFWSLEIHRAELERKRKMH